MYVLARMVFFQAHLLKRKDTKQIGHNLMPTYIIFVSFSLCTSPNKLKTKDKKAWTILESHYMPENGREKPLHIPKMAQKWQKWPFCRGYSKAKWSQMFYTGTEPQNTKNMQKLSSKIIRVATCRNLLNFKKWLDVEKWKNWPFCKGQSKAKWSKWLRSHYSYSIRKSV